jgi:hypothetical protein
MKKLFLLSSCVLLSLATLAQAQPDSSTSTTAANPTASSSQNQATMEAKHRMMPAGERMKHQDCMKIAIACEAAGYRLSRDVSGKNIGKDCVRPILMGQSIAGVQVDASTIQQCKEHKNQMREHMQKRMQERKNQMNNKNGENSTS